MKIIKYIILIVVLAGIVFGIYKVATAPKITEGEIVSRNGLHWHGHLSIVINGKEEIIPANIGVNGVMGAGGDPMELHTHATDGIIHAEFMGLVSKDQLRIKNFFKIWGKDFSKDSILGYKAVNGHTITMTVNGVPNTDFENYAITNKGTYDGGAELGKIDDIKIIYQ